MRESDHCQQARSAGARGSILRAFAVDVVVFGLEDFKEVKINFLANTNRVVAFDNSSMLVTILWSDQNQT